MIEEMKTPKNDIRKMIKVVNDQKVENDECKMKKMVIVNGGSEQLPNYFNENHEWKIEILKAPSQDPKNTRPVFRLHLQYPISQSSRCSAVNRQ